ncbi:MAG: DUF1289 domain-containing protein [Burkholderiales bacterium]
MNPPIPPPGVEVPSPCIDVCRMNPGSGLCEGCGRTLDEIADWSALTADQKSAVLARLAARRPPR